MSRMNSRWLSGLLIAACGLAGVLAWSSRHPTPRRMPSPARDAASPKGVSKAKMVEACGKLPLQFEVNEGQTDKPVKFLSRGSGYSLFLTANEAVLALSQMRIADCGLRIAE